MNARRLAAGDRADTNGPNDYYDGGTYYEEDPSFGISTHHGIRARGSCDGGWPRGPGAGFCFPL